MTIPTWFKQPVIDILNGWGFVKHAHRSYELKNKFKHFGRGSHLQEPIAWVLNPQHISIGDKVEIEPYVRLVACDHWSDSEQKFKPEIVIGNGTHIGWFASIQSNNKVIIGNNVLIGSQVGITDLSHTFYDVNKPIISQPLTEGGYVIIGDGCYIGHGAIILPRVCIGKNVVVGAGAVVTSDVADYSVVVGCPARVVRQYDKKESEWVKK
ncbi:MAG TPA: acyltransferase [Candidatus Omnitrophota bacterium]|nr:acyltransferase [Candidatus Omnitrophota bacterium]